MSLADSISEIVKRHLGTFYEIEARETVLRRHLTCEQRRATLPWIAYGRSRLQQEEFELWRGLDSGEISEAEMLSRTDALMMNYYESKTGDQGCK